MAVEIQAAGYGPPLPQYATNAKIGYMNDWTHLSKRQAHNYQAKRQEILDAQETAAKREARKQARAQKHIMFDAIARRDVDTLRRMLSRNGELLERHTPYGATPLIMAAAVGDPSIVSLLLDAGASVTAADGIGATPLIMAAYKGHEQITKLLLGSKQGGGLGRGYLLRQCTKRGETAVMAAAKSGHLEVVKLLLGDVAGAGGALATDVAGRDALMLACRHSQAAVAQWLMRDQRMNPGRGDARGMTALMHASAGGARDAVDLLLSEEPPLDLHASDQEGYTALHHACMGGDVGVIQALVSKGAQADPNNPDSLRLLLAACKAGQSSAINWLLDRGIGRSALVDEGDDGPGSQRPAPGPPGYPLAPSGQRSHRHRDSPMFAAVKADSVGAVDALLAHGARIDIRDSRGRTPLAWCAEHGCDRMCRLLVARGASMLVTDNHGRVPRQAAKRLQAVWTSQLLSGLAKDALLIPDEQVSSALERDDEEAGVSRAPLTLPAYRPGPVQPPAAQQPPLAQQQQQAPRPAAGAGSGSIGAPAAAAGDDGVVVKTLRQAAPAAPAAASGAVRAAGAGPALAPEVGAAAQQPQQRQQPADFTFQPHA